MQHLSLLLPLLVLILNGAHLAFAGHLASEVAIAAAGGRNIRPRVLLAHKGRRRRQAPGLLLSAAANGRRRRRRRRPQKGADDLCAREPRRPVASRLPADTGAGCCCSTFEPRTDTSVTVGLLLCVGLLLPGWPPSPHSTPRSRTSVGWSPWSRSPPPRARASAAAPSQSRAPIRSRRSRSPPWNS